MNPKNSLWQFVKDGLIGVVVPLIPFGIHTAIIIFIWKGELNGNYFGEMFFFGGFTSPMAFVMLIGFISMGISGRFLENITSRWSWIKSILTISIFSMLIGVVLILLRVGAWDWAIVPYVGTSAVIGFLIAGLAGVIFNPTKRIFRLIIGAVSSTVVGYAFGLIIIYKIIQ